MTDAPILDGRLLTTDPAETVAHRPRGRAAPAPGGSGPDLPTDPPADEVGTVDAPFDLRGLAALAVAIAVAVALVGGVVELTVEPLPPGAPAPGIAAQEPAIPAPRFPTGPQQDNFGPPTGETPEVPEPAAADTALVAHEEPAADGAGTPSEPDPEAGSTEPEPADPEPADPAPADPAPADPEPEVIQVPPPDPSPTTLLTEAGTLVVECAGSTATLVSADLLPGFSVVEAGPGAEVRVSALLLSVVVRCQAGEPALSVELL